MPIDQYIGLAICREDLWQEVFDKTGLAMLDDGEIERFQMVRTKRRIKKLED